MTSMSSRMWSLYLTACVCRLLAWLWTLPDRLADGVLFTTPITSWKGVLEGGFLLSRGLSPYCAPFSNTNTAATAADTQSSLYQTTLLLAAGGGVGGGVDCVGSVHQPPLLLWPLMWLVNSAGGATGGALVAPLFIAADLVTARLLAVTARIQAERGSERAAAAKQQQPAGESLGECWVPLLFLFNPLSVMACAGLSTATLHSTVTATVLYSASSGRWSLCAISWALSCYLDVYPVAMLPPLVAALANSGVSRRRFFVEYACTLLALFYASMCLSGGWQFLHAVYRPIFLVTDLTPNMGLFWYFFSEMFQHFESLFLFSFQLNTLIYAVPLTLRFSERPFLVLFTLLALQSVFRPYPNCSDSAIYMALLPVWRHLAAHMRYTFVVGVATVVTMVMAPVMWTLWIDAGSANANFFFAVVLAFNFSQIFLLTDIVFAASKHAYESEHGKRQFIDGKPARLVLL